MHRLCRLLYIYLYTSAGAHRSAVLFSTTLFWALLGSATRHSCFGPFRRSLDTGYEDVAGFCLAGWRCADWQARTDVGM